MADHDQPLTRRERRLAGRERAHAATLPRGDARRAGRATAQPGARMRMLAFGGIVVAVLAIGGALAFGDFVDRPAGGAAAGTIDVQSSMAGFTPGEITLAAGQTATLNWWTDDASLHLQGGVHTMVAPELGFYEELAAESSRLVTWTVPDRPGTYDVYCETCCGGKDSPSMHGRIVIEPDSASTTGGRAL
jgi:plastocyanin